MDDRIPLQALSPPAGALGGSADSGLDTAIDSVLDADHEAAPAEGLPALQPAAGTVAAEALHAAFVAIFPPRRAAEAAEAPPSSLTDWHGFLARQGVDLALSRVVLDGAGAVDAFALVAPRAAVSNWRLVLIGVRPQARGQGAARRLLRDLLKRATEAGQQQVELEVPEARARALALFQHAGFRMVHRLQAWGWAGPKAPKTVPALPPADVPVVDRTRALAWLQRVQQREPELPMPVTGTLLAALPHGWQAWRRGRAQLVFSPGAAGGPVRVHSFVDLSRHQRQGEWLLRALQSKYAASGIELPPLQRHDLGGEALGRCGFSALPAQRLWMSRSVAPQRRSARDDRRLALSYMTLRSYVGLVAMLLPLALVLGAGLFGDRALEDSISAYYHTGMRNWLVGSLCAIAIFLMCYPGYERRDGRIASFAGAMALGVAFVPGVPSACAAGYDQLQDTAHLGFAVGFLGALAYLAIFEFPRTARGSRPSPGKRRRNRIYYACGAVMLGSMAALALTRVLVPCGSPWRAWHPVLVLESIAVLAFGVSWITKGKAIRWTRQRTAHTTKG